MGEQRKLEELYPRAPRYVIEVGDNETLRFAHMPRGSKIMHTRIVNLSESGLAFLVPYLTSPQEGEKIKVEFSAPNSEPIACFAKVVRVEIHKTYHFDHRPQTFKLVAVEFVSLPSQQRQMLASGLNSQFKAKQRQYQREQFLLQIQWFFIHGLQKLGRFVSLLLPRFLKKKSKKSDSKDLQSYIDV